MTVSDFSAIPQEGINRTVWAWGLGGSSQHGDGVRLTPVNVIGLSGVVAVSGGEGHSLALKSDGTVWAWGENYYGQLVPRLRSFVLYNGKVR